MALTRTNTTVDVRNPSGNTISFSHITNTGNYRSLIVIVASPAISVSTVTYSGQSLTNIRQDNTSYSTYWSVWELIDPPTGTSTITVTLTSGNFNNVSTAVMSFSDSNGIRSTNFNNTQASNQTTTLNVINNSLVIGASIGGNNTTAYIEIPSGTSRTLLWNHGINNYTWGGISTSTTAGSYTVKGGSTSTNIMLAVEISEKVLTNRRVFIV